MINKQELIDVINTELEGSEIFLVEVKVSADNIIDVAIDSMGSVTIDDCIALNNKVLDHFDRDVEDYELTVGSYGISDPFKVLQHYKKNMGGEVEVPTPDGIATLKLPSGTPNGKLFRLRGKGVPDLRGGSPGDLVARIVIEVPTRLTGRQRGQLEDLAKALDPSNFPEAQSFGSKMKVFYQHRDKLRK